MTGGKDLNYVIQSKFGYYAERGQGLLKSYVWVGTAEQATKFPTSSDAMGARPHMYHFRNGHEVVGPYGNVVLAK